MGLRVDGAAGHDEEEQTRVPEGFDLYRFVRFVNSLLFASALALMLDQSMAAAFERFEQIPHWRTDERSLVVVDKTGDRAWNEATRHAVDSWNKVVPGTGLRLTWSKGTGVCQPDGTRIEICQDPFKNLGDDMHDDRQGLADLRLGGDRKQAHIAGTAISVCSNCALDLPRRKVVATHELGHSLGMEHTARLRSVMYPTGGQAKPDAEDAAVLGRLYDHVDKRDRCGAFDLRVGPLCF